MDQLPPDPQRPADPSAASPADMVSAQIKRQLKGDVEPAPAPPAAKTGPERPAAADPGFAFHMRMRAAGNEVTDSAADHKETHGGEEYTPPPFVERGFDNPEVEEGGGGGGGAVKIIAIVLVVAALGAAGWFWGVPAWKAHQEAAGGTAAGTDGKQPPLEAVKIDDEFDTGLRTALNAGNDAWKAAGKDAYVYRYNVTEDTVDGVSQTINVAAEVGGKDAVAGANDHAAFDQGMATYVSSLTAHPGVKCVVRLVAAEEGSTPEPSDKYLRYGYDYGREHMDQIKPIVTALEKIKSTTGSYPRQLSDTVEQTHIRTSGGIAFMARGFGYLPIFKTDSAGDIQLGTGAGTLERMTPAGVSDYYVFLFLGDPAGGLDVLSQTDLDYFSRKVAPLPYDVGSVKLHNVPLKGDGRADGVGAVVKDGKVLREGES